MKRLLTLLLLTGCGIVYGQAPSGPVPYVVATLPDVTANNGAYAWVKDGSTATDCTAGGGTLPVLCRSNGTAWVGQVLGSGGGGGGSTAFSALTGLPTDNPAMASALNAKQNTIAANTYDAFGAGASALTAAQAYSSNATNITTNTVAYARLPVGTVASTIAAANDARFLNATSLSGTSIAGFTGLLYLTSGVPSVATSANVISLWSGGTCVGFLKSDNTCSNTAGAVPAAGLVASNGTALTSATSATVISAFGAGACVGNLRSDGSCKESFSNETVASSATPVFSISFNSSLIILTSDITTFTLPAGGDGQLHSLAFCQNGGGGWNVAAPANVRGLFTIGLTGSACSVQEFRYYTALAAWLATGIGQKNE